MAERLQTVYLFFVLPHVVLRWSVPLLPLLVSTLSLMFSLRGLSSRAHAVAWQLLAFLIIFYASYFLSLAVAVTNVARLQEVLTYTGICLHSGFLVQQPQAERCPEEEALESPGQGAAGLGLSVPTTTITEQALSGENSQVWVLSPFHFPLSSPSFLHPIIYFPFYVFIGFVTVLLLFYGFWPWETWDLSSRTRDRTHTPCIGRQSLDHWTARGFPPLVLFPSLSVPTIPSAAPSPSSGSQATLD